MRGAYLFLHRKADYFLLFLGFLAHLFSGGWFMDRNGFGLIDFCQLCLR